MRITLSDFVWDNCVIRATATGPDAVGTAPVNIYPVKSYLMEKGYVGIGFRKSSTGKRIEVEPVFIKYQGETIKISNLVKHPRLTEMVLTLKDPEESESDEPTRPIDAKPIQIEI